MHSIARVIQEIRLLTENHRVESLAFVDENFAFNRNRLAELCRAMIRENIRITWECQTSANLVDEEILSLAKQAGAIQIAFGFESGSQRILDTLGKKSTVEQNRSAITLVKKAGLKVRGCFMMGNPTETLVDIRLTQAFIKNNDIDYTGVFMATPYPGTELWDYCVSHKRIDPATVDFNTFTTGSEVAPCACAAVDAQVLKRLYAETVYLSMRKNYTWPRIALKFFRYPGEALRLIKSRIPGVTMENRPVTPAKRLVKTIPYAIAVVFALLFIRAVDWRHAFSLLRALDKFAVGAYLVFILVSYLLGAVKYGLIIRGSLPDRKTLYLYFMSKTSGSLTPGRIGDFIPLLSPDFRNKGVAMALFLDKILEFLMLLIFGCAGLAVLKNLPTGILQLWLSGGLACIVFLFLLRRNRFWRFLSAKIPADDDSSPHFRRLAGRAVAFIEKVSYETGMLGNHFYLLLGLTCLTYSLSAAASFVLFHACGLPVPLYMVFELIAVSGLVSLLSFTPSGIGPADLSVLYILQFYGMSAEAFGAYTVVTRTVNLSLLAVPYALLHWLGRKGDA
jgi:uncharacterized protein (TIRG00374 family)